MTSYAGLVHPMGGLHRHIEGSVGSHLPLMQHHAQSWRSGHVGGQPWAPVSKHLSHEQVWCVTLALATINGMLDIPHDRRHVKDLTSPHRHVMQQHPKNGGSVVASGRSHDLGGGWCVCIVSRLMACFPCCPMLHGSSMGGKVLHGIA